MSDNLTLLALLSETSRELTTCFDARLKSMGLTTARGRVLLLLARNQNGVSQAAITNFLRVEHPTTVRILDGLEELGLIQRCPDPVDRRAKVIVLTEAGKPLADEVVVLSGRLAKALLGNFNSADIANAEQFLQTLLSNLAAARSSGSDEGEIAP